MATPVYIPFGAVSLNGPLTGIPSKVPERIRERNRDAIIIVAVLVHIKRPFSMTLGGAFFIDIYGGYVGTLGIIHDCQWQKH
jgi:hypothetical protein